MPAWKSTTVTDTTTYVQLQAVLSEKSYLAIAVKTGAPHTVNVYWSPDDGTTKEAVSGATGLVAGDQKKIEWPASLLYVKGTAGSGSTTIYYQVVRYD